MEENETRAELDYAAEEKKRKIFEEKIKQLVHEIDEKQGYYKIGELGIEKTGKKYIVRIGKNNLLEIDENDNVHYDISGIKNYKAEVEKTGKEDLLKKMQLAKLKFLEELEKKRKEHELPGGLKEVNLSVLVLINPKLRGDNTVAPCKKAYLDPSNKKMIFEDKDGKKHEPKDYGFKEGKSETGSFEITRINKDGKVEGGINPTTIYTIPGKEYSILIDIHEHHKSVTLGERDISDGHVNDIASKGKNLTRTDSGEIGPYSQQLEHGMLEGRFGGRETNQVAEIYIKFKSRLPSNDRKNFQDGMEEGMVTAHGINNSEELKEVIISVLEEDYKMGHEEATKKATRIVDEGDMKVADEIVRNKDNDEEQKVPGPKRPLW